MTLFVEMSPKYKKNETTSKQFRTHHLFQQTRSIFSFSSMHLLLVIATCLVLTANGYSIQRPIRPPIISFQADSHLHLNTGGYGIQQRLASGSLGVHSVAGTRHHQTFKQPPLGVRPYVPAPPHIAAPSSVSSAHRLVAVRPNTYHSLVPHQQGPQGPASYQSSRPYPPQVNAVTKSALPKHPDSGKVITSQAYPVGPAVSSNHVLAHSLAEASQQIKTKIPPTHRWIPSYGASQNPSQQSGSLPTIGGYLQQPPKQPTEQGSNIKKKKEKESTNKNLSPNRETPLQTAYSTTRKPINQETKAKSNRKNPGEAPSIIPQIISHSNALPAGDNYQIHKNPNLSEVRVPSKPNALVPASEAHNYQIPKAIVPYTLSQSESSTPSSATGNSYQETKTSLAPGEGGKHPALSDVTNTYQIPQPSTPSVVSVPQTPSPHSTTTEHYQSPHQVKVTAEAIVPQQYESVKEKESFSDESKEAHYKTPPSETKFTAGPAGDRDVSQQSAYNIGPIEFHSAEQTSQTEATYGGASSERISGYHDVQNVVTATTTTQQPNYSTLQPIEVPSTNPLTVPTTTPFSLPSFDGSAIPKYVLGTYSPLVLPEPPLELAHSAYGVSQLAIEEPQDAPAQQMISLQSTGSYGAPAVSLDNIKSLPLSQQWGYYSAEPFQPASAEISQSDLFSGALGGGYQSPQMLATGAEINNPTSSYGIEQSVNTQQTSGYPSNQQSSAGSEDQTSKQTTNAANQNTFNNQRTSSTDANVEGRQQSFGKDKPPVITLGSENVLNEDGSFSYNYETEDGIKVEVSGYQKQIGADPENAGTVAKGSYSYTAPDGAKISVNWVADENGFQPTGEHIPTPPPVPGQSVAQISVSGKTAGDSFPAQWGQSAHAY